MKTFEVIFYMIVVICDLS